MDELELSTASHVWVWRQPMLETQSDFGTGFSRFQIIEPEKLGDFQRYSEHEASNFVGDSDLSQRVASLKLTVIGYCDEES